MSGNLLLEIFFGLAAWIPVVLPALWTTGAFFFYFRHEKGAKRGGERSEAPFSVLIPCFNEEGTIEATILSLDRFQGRDLEVIAINDGSRDGTLSVLKRLASPRPWMRVVNLTRNRGKAAALSFGAMASRHEFLLCLDADSELDGEAIPWMLRHFEDPKVAAVTGNPRVKNRGTLIGRLQVGEFSALVGMIKRYHQSLGRLFALSGVLVMFRKSAVLDVELWDTETVTEDIGISWKLQVRGWKLRYEPRALCEVLMPDTLKGLWKQRLRWAQGGFEVMSKHAVSVLRGSDLGLKLIVLEYFFSVLWVLAMPVALGARFLTGHWEFFSWTHVVFLGGLISFMQFLAGCFLHARYEPRWFRMIPESIWYPFVYWMLNSCVLFVAIPKVLRGSRQQFSTWVSPDRGGVTYAKNH